MVALIVWGQVYPGERRAASDGCGVAAGLHVTAVYHKGSKQQPQFPHLQAGWFASPPSICLR